MPALLTNRNCDAPLLRAQSATGLQGQIAISIALFNQGKCKSAAPILLFKGRSEVCPSLTFIQRQCKKFLRQGNARNAGNFRPHCTHGKDHSVNAGPVEHALTYWTASRSLPLLSMTVSKLPSTLLPTLEGEPHTTLTPTERSSCNVHTRYVQP